MLKDIGGEKLCSAVALDTGAHIEGTQEPLGTEEAFHQEMLEPESNNTMNGFFKACFCIVCAVQDAIGTLSI